MVDFRIDGRSGVPAYAQIVAQVKQAMRLGWLQAGDKLPTAHEVAASVAINPNTVQKAYRELEYAGLVEGRPGLGTFVRASLSQVTPAALSTLTRRLERWIAAAQTAGLDEDGILDVVRATLRNLAIEDSA